MPGKATSNSVLAVVSAGQEDDPPRDEPAPLPPDPEEAAAIARVQQGDTEQFELLVRHYMRGAFAVAFRLLGHRQDAEDVVQEAMLAALANIRTFDVSRRFGPWLYRIVVTRGLNFRKSRSRRQGESIDRAEFASREAGPEINTERAALREAVQEAMARLPERQRMVVQLFELDGFSGAEIAAMLEIPAGTVRWLLHEARGSLREMLAQFEESAG
jgi:RNA polymerase sigma-70 factor (ECF subfamily)